MSAEQEKRKTQIRKYMLQHNRQNRTRNYEVNIPVKKLSVIQKKNKQVKEKPRILNNDHSNSGVWLFNNKN